MLIQKVDRMVMLMMMKKCIICDDNQHDDDDSYKDVNYSMMNFFCLPCMHEILFLHTL